jgi:predicted GNAT family N-acyltransferase
MHPASLQLLALESGGRQQGISNGEGTFLHRETHPHGRHWPEHIHGPIHPADVRPGDPVSAHLRPPGQPDRQVPSRVWRISPMGVELVRPLELPAILVGTPLDITLRIGPSVSDFRALPLVATGTEKNHDILAFTWGERPAPHSRKRATTRWPCEPEFAPTGIAPSSVRYEDFVYFRVIDVSLRGMQLETSLRNKFLVPGVEMDATCTFPTQGQVHLTLRVVHTRVVQRGQKKVLALGVRATARSAGSLEIIGQYLLRFGAGATVKQLCAEGYRIHSSRGALDLGSMQTQGEYQEVLRLRRLAYVEAKKVSADTKHLDMADAFDARSRVLVAKHRGEVVGTVRLMFPQTAEDALKHEDFLPLPPLPPRERLVEVSKACTHPGYRGSDLFYRMLMHAGLVILQSGRRYALMSATDSLAPIYERFGFRRTGACYDHPSMRLRHHLMLLDVADVVEGTGINPLFWNLVGGWELWKFGRLCGIVSGDPWTSVRVRLWRLLHPVAQVVRILYQRRLRSRGAVR